MNPSKFWPSTTPLSTQRMTRYASQNSAHWENFPLPPSLSILVEQQPILMHTNITRQTIYETCLNFFLLWHLVLRVIERSWRRGAGPAVVETGPPFHATFHTFWPYSCLIQVYYFYLAMGFWAYDSMGPSICIMTVVKRVNRAPD